MQTNATFSVVISTKNRWRAPKLTIDRSLKFPCCRLVIMTMRVFIRNIAGGDSINVVLQGVLYLASPACPPVPVMGGHLQCTDTFAWSRGCPFMTGTTVEGNYDFKSTCCRTGLRYIGISGYPTLTTVVDVRKGIRS